MFLIVSSSLKELHSKHNQSTRQRTFWGSGDYNKWSELCFLLRECVARHVWCSKRVRNTSLGKSIWPMCTLDNKHVFKNDTTIALSLERNITADNLTKEYRTEESCQMENKNKNLGTNAVSLFCQIVTKFKACQTAELSFMNHLIS